MLIRNEGDIVKAGYSCTLRMGRKMVTILGGDLVQRLGPILFTAGLVYSVFALMVTIATLGGGAILHIQLVPDIINDIYVKTYESWSTLASHLGKEVSIYKLPIILWDILKVTVSSTFAIFGLFVTATLVFFIIAIQITELIPPPFTIVSVLTWIVAVFAQIILLQYVIQKILPIVTNLINTATSIFGRAISTI